MNDRRHGYGPEPMGHLVRWVIRFDGYDFCCLAQEETNIVVEARPINGMNGWDLLEKWAREGKPGITGIVDEHNPDKFKDYRLSEVDW